jgi:hypothetical protein
MGRKSREKGARFERAVAAALVLVYPEARRGLGQARSAKEVPDVDARGLWPECKRQIRPNPFRALEQAIEASNGSGRTPIAICRSDHGEATATLRFVDLLALLACVEGALLDPVALEKVLDAVNADR